MKNRLSLTKLSLVEIDCIRSTAPVPSNNGILEAFLTLPSIQAVRLSDLDPNYKIHNPLPPTPHPNLTELHFVHCTITNTQLTTLLSHTTSLRLFSYDHATDPFPPPLPKRNNLGPLLDLVLHHAKSSLTYLNYTTSSLWPGDEPPHRIGPVGSFRAYENLSTMRLSRAVLLENINSALPRRLAKRCAPKKLVDSLPASLQQLELVGQFSAAEAKYLFSDMLEKRTERVPCLRYIVFQGGIPFAEEEVVRAYERVGIVMDWRILDHKDARVGRFWRTGGQWVGGVECVAGRGMGGMSNIWS